jgi:hypothetical protein
MTAPGEPVETFDVGPTLLVSEQDDQERVEVTVAHDNLTGENDEIELSIHVYRKGEPEFLPVIPRLIFSMTQEKEIWKLAEATLEVHVPLTASGFAAAEANGYHFAISGCEGTPASRFQVTAVPLDSDSERKAFCTDESATVRFDAGGKGCVCLNRGQVLNRGADNFAGPVD